MSRLMSARTRAVAVLAAGGALAVGGLAGLAPMGADASSHREAPLISGQPQYDNTDVYAFVSPDKPDTTTLIANFIPFEAPPGGPNFYKFASDAHYDIKVDSNGDAQPDLTYRFTFQHHYKNWSTFLYNTGPVHSLNDPNLNYTQTYDLQLIRPGRPAQTLISGAPVAPSDVGMASMPDYGTLRNQAIKRLPGGGQVFAGQADDPFALDLRVFDLLYGGNLKEVGNDSLAGYNVNSIALQIPTKQLAPTQPIIGVCSTVDRQSAVGGFAQVSRLCNPLVNEAVIPLRDKDRYNASSPWNDAQFAKYVTNPELPKLIQKIYNIPAPAEPRNDLVQAFLTGVPKLNQPPHVQAADELRLNTSIPPSKDPKRLGVLDGDNAGFPNGRRLTDDVVDIELQAVEGELLGKKNDLGDGVNANDVPFGQAFPYLALPHSGSEVPGTKAASGKPGSYIANSDKGTSMLNAGKASNDTSTKGSSSMMMPMAATGMGAAFLGGGGLMWLRHRRKVRA